MNNKNNDQNRKLYGLENASKVSTKFIIVLQLILGTLPMVFVVYFIDRFVNGKSSLNLVMFLAVALFIAALLRGLLYAVSIWQVHKFAYDALVKIRMQIIKHLEKLPLGFFQKHRQGKLVNVIHYDVEQIEKYLAHGLPEILAATFLPALLWLIIMLLDWRLGLALIALLPVSILLQKIFHKLWAATFQNFSKSMKKMSEDLLEYVAGISAVKAFSNEETRTQNLLTGIDNYTHWIKKSMFGIVIPMTFIAMFLEGGLVVLTIVGVTLVSQGSITIPTFILALILGGLFSSSFAKLHTFQHIGIMYNQSINNIKTITDVPVKEQTNTNIANIKPSLSFHNVSFAYPIRQKENANTEKDAEQNTIQEKVFDNISLEFSAYSHTAIVGESGSGKTTLANMMMGFWQAQAGEILIDNKNINDFSENNIAELFSLVGQEVFLFNITIKENIRLSKPNATMQEIEKAARQAQIHDFIMQLPQGYNTIAGESGVKFSGGEKQRIAIARMFLKNTPFVVLDEATAALDKENEKLIQLALQELQKEKTVITIAHRLHTIKTMDNIIVMDKGKILAKDKHKNLLKTSALYKEMIEKQELVTNWKI